MVIKYPLNMLKQNFNLPQLSGIEVSRVITPVEAQTAQERASVASPKAVVGVMRVISTYNYEKN